MLTFAVLCIVHFAKIQGGLAFGTTNRQTPGFGLCRTGRFYGCLAGETAVLQRCSINVKVKFGIINSTILPVKAGVNREMGTVRGELREDRRGHTFQNHSMALTSIPGFYLYGAWCG